MATKWTRRFLGLAAHVASWSKDPSTQVGAVIVNDQRIVVGMGYNGFPRGVHDDPSYLENRAFKYPRTIHAEVNAVLNATVSVRGCTIYVTAAPCAPCTALLIQAGITRMVHPVVPTELAERWAESFAQARFMQEEAGIQRIVVEEKIT